MRFTLPLLIAATFLSACSQSYSTPEKRAQNASARADTKAALSTAKTVTVEGKTFRVAHVKERNRALVEFVGTPTPYFVSDLEAAARAVTGCSGNFEPGLLSGLDFTTFDLSKVKSKVLGRFNGYWINFSPECSRGQSSSGAAAALTEGNSRANTAMTYPKPNTTHLSFSKGHGFQVSYLGPTDKVWLWYPRNRKSLPGEYKIAAVQKGLCYRYPSNSYNPVTKTTGGNFQCESLADHHRLKVAELPGDPFSLRTGKIPYQRDRCNAPKEFSFDRNAISC